MRALTRLICALVLLAFLLAGVGFRDSSPGPALAQERKAGKDKDRCIHKLCKELVQVEILAKRCLREEEKEKDKRDVKHLKVIIRHLEEAIKECRRAGKE
jgi:hypothetical protein